MSTTELEHRIALAIVARNRCAEGSWGRDFWNQIIWQLERRRT